MRHLAGTSLVALALALLLASLSVVAWRQADALETMAVLDRLRRERTLAAAELEELRRRAQLLESRTRLVPMAEERLGMRVPAAAEIVILTQEAG